MFFVFIISLMFINIFFFFSTILVIAETDTVVFNVNINSFNNNTAGDNVCFIVLIIFNMSYNVAQL